jgi:hypothetical protein
VITQPKIIICGIDKRSRIVGNKEYTLFLTSLGIASNNTRCIKICLSAKNTPETNQIIIISIIGRMDPIGIIRKEMLVNGNKNSTRGEFAGGGGRRNIIKANRL